MMDFELLIERPRLDGHVYLLKEIHAQAHCLDFAVADDGMWY